ncbi:energy transduction protein TonB [Campylobacter sp. RM5004]|uniref:TonB family protein n=1 Tax=Campylobacter sp. RM5004 TaxID=1660078 RepID=UPI001EFA9B46|nr:TonB family protein [Campylobacter sp. RM5004]ULO01089.1 energy transduction protein TonB [Campylobacter sp. RM5004]
MKISLLQHKNKIAFFISFLIHAILLVYFLKFDVKASEIKNDKALSVLFYTPSVAIKEEVIKEEIIEEPLAIKKKHFKKPKKEFKKERKKEVKKEIKEEQVIKEEAKQEINEVNNQVSNIKDNKPSNETMAGGNTKDELISHIQSVLNKSAKKNYPMSSRKRREQGIVVVGFTYDYGNARNIKIIKASKYENLNQAGIKSVENAKFKRYDRILDISVPLKFSLH